MFFRLCGENKESGFEYSGSYSEQHVEGDRCVCFFSAMASEARGERPLSVGAEEGVLMTGEVSKWHILESVPVVRREVFVCLFDFGRFSS